MYKDTWNNYNYVKYKNGKNALKCIKLIEKMIGYNTYSLKYW